MNSDDHVPTLSAYLSQSGVTSRRNAATLIKEGHVSINGETELSPAVRVYPGDVVMCNGKTICMDQKNIYLMLNKPIGYVCTNDDVFADKKAIDLLSNVPGNPRLFSAGRLDKDSEGIIIFSNDGYFVNKLSHPRFSILKTYHVTLERNLTSAECASMLRGVLDAGEMLKVISIRQLGDRRYEFVLNEGKKREIRRITAHMGAPTITLRRVAIGGLELGDLKPGKYRILGRDDLKSILDF